MTHDHDTDRHHAQILDWLTAALTDETILKITLEQDQDDAGQWYAQTHHLVDVEWEAAASSRANQKTLAQAEEEEEVTYPATGACRCQDCQALDALESGGRPFDPSATWAGVREAIDNHLAGQVDQDPALTKEEWETALTEDVEWTTTTHGEKITATFTGPRDRLTDLLLALYGYAQKEN